LRKVAPPATKTPPASVAAALRLTVALVSLSVPPRTMSPPPPTAELAATVELVSVTAPSLLNRPPLALPAELLLTVVLDSEREDAAPSW
jgi:hypothetical protein